MARLEKETPEEPLAPGGLWKGDFHPSWALHIGI